MADARRFELVGGSSRKFWEITLDGASLTVRFGRIGTAGQVLAKAFPSDAAARAERDKLVREKTQKGYTEVGAALAVPAPVAAPPATPAKAPSVAPAHEEGAAGGEPTAPVEEALPRVRWTDSARRRRDPRRGQGLAPSRRAPDAAASFARLRELWKAVEDQVARGEAEAPPDCRPLIAAVRESFAGGATPATSPDAMTEAARAVLLGTENVFVRDPGGVGFRGGPEVRGAPAAVLDWWGAAGGLPLAVRALIEADRLERLGREEALWIGFRTTPTSGWFEAAVPEVWRELRRRLSGSDDAEHAAAGAEAARLWEGASLPSRCGLAYLFPDRPQWAAEAARAVLAGQPVRERQWWLFASLADADAATELARHASPGFTGIPEAGLLSLVEGLGPGAFGPLVALLEKADYAEPRRAVLGALALIESEEVAALFAAAFDDKDARPLAAEYFPRVPGLAVRALAPLAGRRPAAATLLRAIVAAHPALAESQAAHLEPGARAAVESALGAEARLPAEASPEELPPVLVRPPWLERREPPPLPPVVTGLVPPSFEERLEWDAGERERLQGGSGWRYSGDHAPHPTKDARRRAELEEQRRRNQHAVGLWPLLRLTDASALDVWNTFPASFWEYVGPEEPLLILARLGLPALPGLLALAERDLSASAAALSRVASPRVAPLMADAFHRLKKSRPAAERWLLAFPDEAAASLVPVAIGERGKPRDAAGAALRFLGARGHAERVRAAARRHGPEAAAALDAVLAFDPLRDGAARVPRMPAFWSAHALPRPLLRGRERSLPLPAVDALGGLLALSSLEDAPPALGEVREALDPRSADEFAWGLCSAWQDAGHPAREAWAFHALGHLGGDESARRLTPLVREWPTQGLHARAVEGLDVLARIGTDVALMHLHGIAQRVRSRPLQERAAAKMEEVARRRGLSPEQLADRLVPDLGLDADGSRVLDFGPRAFRVGFDAQLRPFVRDASGQRLSDLPRPGRSDDAARAEEATATWKALRRDARSVATAQIARLERAMCTRRRWDGTEFKVLLVEHPLVTHLVQRLVWASFDPADRILATFRVAEDRSLADAADVPFDLPATARVGLPHPAEMTLEAIEGWARLFGDYEVLQPFPQLGRAVFRPTEEEKHASALRRVVGRKVHPGAVLGLERRGWRRGAVEDGGVSGSMEKPLAGLDHDAVLALDPGLYAGDLASTPEQTLGEVYVQRRGTWDEKGRLRLGQLDPVVFSELVADVLSLGS